MFQKVEPVATASSSMKTARMMKAPKLGVKSGKTLLMVATTATLGKLTKKKELSTRKLLLTCELPQGVG
jgi:hypothetical protein